MTISLLPKLAGEVRSYRHDWSPFLGEDTIASQSNTITGATLDGSTIETGDQSVVFTISAGTSGTVATLTHTITTAAGDEEQEIFRIPIGAEEPVSLREAKFQTRMLNDDSEDEFLEGLIAPARAYVERVGRRLFVGGPRTETFNRFGDYIEIWRQPIASIDSVTYSTTAYPDDDAAYTGFVANLGFPARIYPALDDDFPDLIDGGTVTVTYTADALDEGSDEYLISKRAMLLLIGYWFEYREAFALGTVSPDFDFALRSMFDELRPVSAY